MREMSGGCAYDTVATFPVGFPLLVTPVTPVTPAPTPVTPVTPEPTPATPAPATPKQNSGTSSSGTNVSGSSFSWLWGSLLFGGIVLVGGGVVLSRRRKANDCSAQELAVASAQRDLDRWTAELDYLQAINLDSLGHQYNVVTANAPMTYHATGGPVNHPGEIIADVPERFTRPDHVDLHDDELGEWIDTARVGVDQATEALGQAQEALEYCQQQDREEVG